MNTLLQAVTKAWRLVLGFLAVLALIVVGRIAGEVASDYFGWRKSTPLLPIATDTRGSERERFDLAVDQLEARYSELNPKSQRYNRPVVEKILRDKTAYESRGYPPTVALLSAARDAGYK